MGPVHDEEDIKGVAGTLYGGTSVDRDDLPGAHTSHVLISCSGYSTPDLSCLRHCAEPFQTSATLAAFILAMILHPDVFAKAQAEIDHVVGSDRLPDFQDRNSLPYVESVVKEVYRYEVVSFQRFILLTHATPSSWHCPVPLGQSFVTIGPSIIRSPNHAAVPHRSMNDDQYRGYDIPANTIIIPNVWSVCPSILVLFLTSSRHRAMTRDEQVYPDAHKFNPERFLNQSGPETDPKDFVFGFGRRQATSRSFWLYHLSSPSRVCPGKAFADANVWIAAACIIAAFEAPVSRNERGEKVVPLPQFTSGFVRCECTISITPPLSLIERNRHPVPFSCDMKPRSRLYSELINQAVDTALP